MIIIQTGWFGELQHSASARLELASICAEPGLASAKLVASGFQARGMSEKLTPLIVATVAKCYQLFVGLPQFASNFFRAATVVVRSRVFFGRHLAAGLL